MQKAKFMGQSTYIRFDWAMKRMLRDKANFAVLEGLLTVLLNEQIKILEILESEGNQLTADDKFNRVDIKAKDSKGDIIIVEIQNTREIYYLERILYGVAKAITEHISLGHSYQEIKKVYSISILYFDIGKGKDYLYHGQNQFVGVHTGDKLLISTKQENAIVQKLPAEIFPEYYLIRVNEFNKVAKTPLEEWISYLKTGEISPDTTAPGLPEAREKLKYYSMSAAERHAYDEHINAIMIQNDVLSTAKLEGLEEGRIKGFLEGQEKGIEKGIEKGLAEGIEKGRAEGIEKGMSQGKVEIARQMKRDGLSVAMIARYTGLTETEIEETLMRPRIFIAIQYLEIGGAERSLIGLLNAFDYSRVDVDLFVYRHTGEFMSLIPKQVNLLPEVKAYAAINRPIKDIVRDGYIKIALGRLWAHVLNKRFCKKHKSEDSIAIFQYVASCTTPFLPSLKHFGVYDLAISFLIPHNIVRDKVMAKQKWAWIHTDYSFVNLDVKKELPVWKAYDRIITISESVSKGFLSRFPSLGDKLLLMENILSETFVREQADLNAGYDFNHLSGVKLCSVARFSYPKAIDRAVLICKALVNMGLDVHWFIVGYGGDEELILKNIRETGMGSRFILLGKKTNPYPYIKACDIYVQPSRYEGKAVTVREAQILNKPVVITNFPTSASQLTDGVDGAIVPNDVDGAAEGIAAFIKDTHKQEQIIEYLHTHHYGNESEVDKIYKAI